MSKDPFQGIDDKELLQRYYRTQNNEWVGVLLQRYTLLLYGVCVKYLKDEDDAKDCVQQIFLKVIQEVEKYKIEYFKSWLYMVAKNQCLTILRDKKGKTVVALTEQHTHTFHEVEYANREHSETASDMYLDEALHSLNKEQYECVTLFYLQKRSYQQISDITDYSVLKVKSYIQNGKRNLRIIIEKLKKEPNTNHAG